MITSQQIRAARAMLNLSRETVCAETGLAVSELAAIEDGSAAGNRQALETVKNVLSRHGVVFLAAGEDDPRAGPGLRLRADSVDEGIRPENLSSANNG